MDDYKKQLKIAVEKYIEADGDPSLWSNGTGGKEWDMIDIDALSMECNEAQGFSIDYTREGRDTAIPYLTVSYYESTIGYRIIICDFDEVIHNADEYVEACAAIKGEIETLQKKMRPVTFEQERDMSDDERREIARLIEEGNNSGILDDEDGYRCAWELNANIFKN